MATQELERIQLSLDDFGNKKPFEALDYLGEQLGCVLMISFSSLATPTTFITACSAPHLVVSRDDGTTFEALIASGGAAQSGEGQDGNSIGMEAQRRAAKALVELILRAGQSQSQKLLYLSPKAPLTGRSQNHARQIVIG